MAAVTSAVDAGLVLRREYDLYDLSDGVCMDYAGMGPSLLGIGVIRDEWDTRDGVCGICNRTSIEIKVTGYSYIVNGCLYTVAIFPFSDSKVEHYSSPVSRIIDGKQSDGRFLFNGTQAAMHPQIHMMIKFCLQKHCEHFPLVSMKLFGEKFYRIVEKLSTLTFIQIQLCY